MNAQALTYTPAFNSVVQSLVDHFPVKADKISVVREVIMVATDSKSAKASSEVVSIIEKKIKSINLDKIDLKTLEKEYKQAASNLKVMEDLFYNLGQLTNKHNLEFDDNNAIQLYANVKKIFDMCSLLADFYETALCVSKAKVEAKKTKPISFDELKTKLLAA